MRQAHGGFNVLRTGCRAVGGSPKDGTASEVSAVFQAKNGRKSVTDGSVCLEMAQNASPEGTKQPQSGPTWPKRGLRWPNVAFKCLKMHPRFPNLLPKCPPKTQPNPPNCPPNAQLGAMGVKIGFPKWFAHLILPSKPSGICFFADFPIQFVSPTNEFH